MKNPIYNNGPAPELKLAEWQKQNPELQRLLEALFDLPEGATEEQILVAGRRFAKAIAPFLTESPMERAALESLQANIAMLELSMLSPTDRAVCKQLGLTARDFLKSK